MSLYKGPLEEVSKSVGFKRIRWMRWTLIIGILIGLISLGFVLLHSIDKSVPAIKNANGVGPRQHADVAG